MVAGVIIFMAGLVLVGSLRTRGSIAKDLDMSLFLVSLPIDSAASPAPLGVRAPDKPDRPRAGSGQAGKELFSVMENLYSSFSNLEAKGWNKFLYGEPYMSLEMAVDQISGDVRFYVAVPGSWGDIFEKRLSGVFPRSRIEKIKSYNIFNSQGISFGAYFKLNKHPILSLRTYQKIGTGFLDKVMASLSKLEREGEGAAIQVLIRPAYHNANLAQRTSREMEAGYKFKAALSRAGRSFKDRFVIAQNQPKEAISLEDDIIKAIQTKASKPAFDTNIRVIVSAANSVRAKHLLDDLTGAFNQFSAPGANSLRMIKAKSRALDRLVFNFSHRIFDNSSKALLSSEEVTSLYHFPVTASTPYRAGLL